MPDPITYLKAFVAALSASAIIVLAFRVILRRMFSSAAALVPVLAVAGGLVVGYWVLDFAGSWPPANALNRFLTLVLPASVIVEMLALIAGVRANASKGTTVDDGPLSEPRVPRQSGLLLRRFAGTLRLSLYMTVGPILLHGSVYVRGIGSGHSEAWPPVVTAAMLCLSFGLLTATADSLKRLSQRSAAGSIPLSIAMAILSAGITTMLAGYIKGGAAAIPLAAALIGTTLATPLLLRSTRLSHGETLHGAISIGVVGLFSLLCIGRFFGQITSLSASVIFLSPLLCWISEARRLHSRATWQIASLRLLAVSIPLVIVLIAAKSHFDQKMATLLASSLSLTAQPKAPACPAAWKPAPLAGR